MKFSLHNNRQQQRS